MPEKKPFQHLLPADGYRVFQVSLSTTDHDGNRRECSVRVASPFVLALAGLFLLRAVIPSATDALARLIAPPGPEFTHIRTASAKPAITPGDLAGGLAPGAIYGEAYDVITPLNVRDPSALVMAPAGHY